MIPTPATGPSQSFRATSPSNPQVGLRPFGYLVFFCLSGGKQWVREYVGFQGIQFRPLREPQNSLNLSFQLSISRLPDSVQSTHQPGMHWPLSGLPYPLFIFISISQPSMAVEVGESQRTLPWNFPDHPPITSSQKSESHSFGGGERFQSPPGRLFSCSKAPHSKGNGSDQALAQAVPSPSITRISS